MKYPRLNLICFNLLFLCLPVGLILFFCSITQAQIISPLGSFSLDSTTEWLENAFNNRMPDNVTIIDTDTTAYQKHITTAHFKKYKTTVEHMVKKLELVDVKLIGSAKQPGL